MAVSLPLCRIPGRSFVSFVRAILSGVSLQVVLKMRTIGSSPCKYVNRLNMEVKA
jgi:hypothetical protein